MTPSDFIRDLARAITRAEDLTDAETQDAVYELALRIYQLLFALPSAGLERQLKWRQLRPQLLTLLQRVTDAYAASLASKLQPLEAEVLRLTALLLQLGTSSPLPTARATRDILATTAVMTQPLEQLLAPNAITGISPYTLQLLRLLERSVNAALLRNADTPQVAQTVLAARTRAGRTTAVPLRGTVANAWRERNRATTAAAFWALVAPAQQRITATAALSGVRTSSWEWVAVLDPRTCPICRPLDGTTAPTPSQFPGGPPPRHPACRCILLPQLLPTPQLPAA